jgi:hypothetical protein
MSAPVIMPTQKAMPTGTPMNINNSATRMMINPSIGSPLNAGSSQISVFPHQLYAILRQPDNHQVECGPYDP